MAYHPDDSDLLWKRLLSAKHIPRRSRRMAEHVPHDYPDGDFEPVVVDLSDPTHRWPDILYPIAESPD